MNKQIRSRKEKDIKSIHEQLKIYKEKAEEEEGKVEGSRRTINSLNEYLSDVKKINKDLIDKGKDSSERQQLESEERNVNEREEMDRQLDNEHQKKVKIYVGNIDDDIEEKDLRTIFEDDAEITLKRKERNQRKYDVKMKMTVGMDINVKLFI